MTAIIFRTAGAGPPLLFIHAFPLNSAMWAAQMDALADSALLLAPDLPGFGASAQTHAPDGLDAIARVIHQGAQERGIKEAVVAGCSMGGYLAFALLRVAPEFVRGLAFIDTKASTDSAEGRAKRLELAQRAEREGCHFLVSDWPQGALSAATLAGRPDIVERVREMIAQATVHGVAAAQRAMAARHDSTPLLATISVPAVVIHGLDDPIIPEAEARAMAGAIRNATFIGVPNAGHLPNLEQPAMVNRALRELLRAVHGRTVE